MVLQDCRQVHLKLQVALARLEEVTTHVQIVQVDCLWVLHASQKPDHQFARYHVPEVHLDCHLNQNPAPVHHPYPLAHERVLEVLQDYLREVL